MTQIHTIVQGSDAWHEFRLHHFGASEAAAMLGLSKTVTRSELLRAKHTGIAREFSDFVQTRILDRGHELEAQARPVVERLIDTELFPATFSDGALSASCDGIDMLGELVFEHKQWSADLSSSVLAGVVPDEHMPQVQQLLMVTGARRAIFVVSDGTEAAMAYTYVEPDQQWFERIRAGWAQFEKDLDSFELPPAAPAAPVGKAPEQLPALHIEVTGRVTASNLVAFKATALTAIRSVSRDLQTDQDFADAEKAVKWCAEVESRLAAAKEHALSQTTSIDELFRAIDDISAEARRVRLDLDKLVTKRKVELKEQAVIFAKAKLNAHIHALNAEIKPAALQPLAVDFGGAIKGLKTLDSVQDKLDAALAAAKIEADAQAKAIRANLAAYREAAAGFEFLFADLAHLVHRPAEDFGTLVQARIATHKAAEAERERKRQEEADRRAAAAAAEAAAKAAAVAPPAPAPTPAASVEVQRQQQIAGIDPAATTILRAAPAADEPATLNLGAVCERLGFTMTAAFVTDALHIKPAKIDRRSVLYRESDFDRICLALQQHIERTRLAQREAEAA